ncbi:MAG: VOC family protein [Kiloniellaceae bacterium]
MSSKNKAAEAAAAQGMHCLTPHLVCREALKAIDFYKAAFGAEELIVVPGPDGKVMHACLSINGSSVMLVEESLGCAAASPQHLGGTPVTLHLIVDDADAAAARAVEAGAKVVMPVDDQFWGDRYGIIEDPFGHRWSIATPGENAPGSVEEIQEAARKAFAEMAGTP